MKTKSHIIILILLMVCPRILPAQWSMVRFDELNYFTKMETVTPDAALSFGLLSSNGSFMMRTNDGGTTWDSLDVIVSGNTYQIASAGFTDVLNGYAGGLSNGLQALIQTADNGATWTDVTPDPSTAYQINGISFLDPVNGFVSSENAVYKTINGGQSWTTFTPGIEINDIGFASMSIGYAAGTVNPDAVIVKTNDGGQTWNNVLTATIPFFSTSSIQKIDVIDQDVIFASGKYANVIYKSLNGGSSWDTITIVAIYDIMDFDFVNQLKGHVVSSMGEIYSTNDGGLTWTLDYAVAGGMYGPSVFLTSISFAGSTGYVCGTNGLIKKYETSTGMSPINESIHQIQLYPNPVHGNAILHIGNFENDFNVEIIDVSGRTVRIYKSQNAIDLNNLSIGVYYLKVISNNEIYGARFVVSK